MSTTERDKTRAHLVTVGAYPDGPPGPHLAITNWFDQAGDAGAWAHSYALCGYTVPQGELPAGTEVGCERCASVRPDFERNLTTGAAVQAARQRLQAMVRTDPASMTVWSDDEVQAALDGFAAAVRAATLTGQADRIEARATTLTAKLDDLAIFVAKAQQAEARVLQAVAAELRAGGLDGDRR